MESKKIKSIFCCMLILMLIIASNCLSANAKTNEKTSEDYVKLSEGSIEKVLLVSSYDDFKTKLEMGAEPLFIPQASYSTSYFGKKFSVSFTEPGYIIFCATGADSYADVEVYRDISNSILVKDVAVKKNTKYSNMPVEAGTYYFSVGYLKSFYLGFVPANSMCSIKGIKQSNGSVYIDITSLDDKAKITAVAVKGTKSTASCYNDSWLKGDYECTNKDNMAEILLPKAGKYTIMVETEYSSECHNRFVYQINTKELTGDSSKLETPISILAGTNVIVGYAEPASTVYATYNDVDYCIKVDSNGIYRLKVKTLKKNKSVKMWQVVNGKTTAEGSFKVVKKY